MTNEPEVPPDFFERVNLPAVTNEEAEHVERDFWEKFRSAAGRIPFSEDLVAAFYCARDPETPTRVRGILLGALAYFILPADLIPDIITGFGFTDDATVLATAISIVGGHINASHRSKAKETLLKPESEAP